MTMAMVTTAKTKPTYEQVRQLIIWLGLVELTWISYWLLSNDQTSLQFEWATLVWMTSMVIWMGAVIRLGRRGFFLQWSRYFSNMVGISIVLTFSALLFGFVPAARDGVILAAGSTSDLQLISIHTLRLLGIGAVIKYLQGELPLHFVIIGSLPDMLFAASAVAVMFLTANGSVGHDFLVVWHLIGFSVFFGAGVSMFLSVPSLLRVFNSKPDASIVFQYPMLLAPNFTVPLFMLAHIFALVKLFTI